MADETKTTTEQIVAQARRLERLMAQRRRHVKRLAELEHEILTTRRFLNALTRPFEPGRVDRECSNCGRLLSAHDIGELDVCTAANEARL